MIVIFDDVSHNNGVERMLACMFAQQLLKKHGIKYQIKSVKRKNGIYDNSTYEISFNNPEDYSAYMIMR